MSKIVNIKDHPKLAQFVRRAYPSYRKHKVILCVTSGLTLSGGSWDGGSRSSYSGATINGEPFALRYNTTPSHFNGGKPDTIAIIEPDTLVLQSGTFCGKPATLTLYALQETIDQLI